MIEVLKQMLEVLEYWDVHGGLHQPTEEAIEAGRKAIAELESQEPVAINWNAIYEKLELIWYRELSADEGLDEIQDLIDTHPPQRTWVGLSDGEAHRILSDPDIDWMQKWCAIEAKLKEKNT